MILDSEAATAAAGASLAERVRPGDIITLDGPLGAGKTTLVRGLLHALGHEAEVPSPSFSLIQPYEELALPVLHVDLYRLEDPEELWELGLETAADGLLVVEWPDRAGPGAFPNALRLILSIEPDDETRRLTWAVPAAWEGRWP